MCLALPVVFMMMSKGFASTWRASAAWLILSGLILVGLLVGHWLLLRWRGDAEDAPWILPVSAALMIALFFVARVG
ncbi:MAG: urate hydroxylase PuuD [Alphaproteobacteria bacterium]|nr:urate hydroxylase PuuD [Alphaproteobacteria bacterium]